jgi:hypothetical protein
MEESIAAAAHCFNLGETTMLSRLRFQWLAFALLGFLISATRAEDQPEEKQKPAREAAEDASSGTTPDQALLEKKFAEDMSEVVFSGNYSVTREGKETPAAMEKYTIASVSKVKDDLWLFTARIQYGKHDITIPMRLQVKWAGDTPMITLTNLTIPGLGTFTSRVLIYGDRYAGTWQHGNTGGHLWGRIEKVKKPADAEEGNGKPEKVE